jgi:hypothetical protein
MANNESESQNALSDIQNDHDHGFLEVNAPFRYETRVSKVRDAIISA